MAKWIIHPSWKKSLIERQYFHKGTNTVMAETGWRWGSFEVETEGESMPLISAGDNLWDCGYDVELLETSDGCWEDVDLDECDDETRKFVEQFFDEGNRYYDLEEQDGWRQGDCEMIIDCDPIFERVDGPNAGKRYDVDGDEITGEQKWI